MRGEFDEAGRLDPAAAITSPSPSPYWDLLDRQLQEHPPVKHVGVGVHVTAGVNSVYAVKVAAWSFAVISSCHADGVAAPVVVAVSLVLPPLVCML